MIEPCIIISVQIKKCDRSVIGLQVFTIKVACFQLVSRLVTLLVQGLKYESCRFKAHRLITYGSSKYFTGTRNYLGYFTVVISVVSDIPLQIAELNLQQNNSIFYNDHRSWAPNTVTLAIWLFGVLNGIQFCDFGVTKLGPVSSGLWEK